MPRKDKMNVIRKNSARMTNISCINRRLPKSMSNRSRLRSGESHGWSCKLEFRSAALRWIVRY